MCFDSEAGLLVKHAHTVFFGNDYHNNQTPYIKIMK